MKNSNSLIISLVLLLVIAASASVMAQSLPTPNLAYGGSKEVQYNGKQITNYKLSVSNFADYSSDLFTAAPNLPPCYGNDKSSRTWVDVYDSKTKKKIYGFCAIQQPSRLGDLGFGIEKGKTAPESVYVTITDRKSNKQATSNTVAITPNPTFKLGSGPQAPHALFDLTARSALYFTGTKTDRINTKNDKYVAGGGSLTVTRESAASCEGNTCVFNVGFFASRSGNVTGALSTYAAIQVEKVGLVGNTISFADQEKSKQGVLPVKLNMGVNKLTFTIDPYKKISETDETNNSFSVTVTFASGKP